MRIATFLQCSGASGKPLKREPPAGFGTGPVLALTLIRKLNECRLLNGQYVVAYLSQANRIGAPLSSRCVAGGA
jgi:hypothetical protein